MRERANIPRNRSELFAVLKEEWYKIDCEGVGKVGRFDAKENKRGYKG